MNELEQARALMPAWIAWGAPASYLFVTAVGSALAVRLAVMMAYRGRKRLSDAHWTERARAAYPARLATALSVLALPAFFGAMAPTFTGPLSLLSPLTVGGLAVGLALLATTQVHWRLHRQVLPHPPSLRQWLAGVVVRWLAVAPILPIVLLLAATCPDHLVGWRSAVWLVGGVALLWGVVRGWGLRLASILGLASAAGDRLKRIVKRAAERAGRPSPPSFELRWPLANALAFPLAGLLAFSDGALAALGDDEIEAVAAHELGHLAEPRSVLATRAALALAFLPLAAARAIITDAGVAAYVAVLIGFMLVLIAVRRVAQRMEKRADEHAVRDQDDEGVYAHALAKIYRFNAVPAVLTKRAIHPALYDRVIAAGGAPSYARPRAPRRWLAHVGLAAGIVLVAVLLIGGRVVLSLWPVEADAEVPQWIDLAAGSGRGCTLAWLADVRWQRQELADAAVLYAAAERFGGDEAGVRPRLATVLMLQGRCDEARAVMLREIEATGELESDSDWWLDALPCANDSAETAPSP